MSRTNGSSYNSLSPSNVYEAIVQFTAGAESTRWNRFQNFITANSLLVLGWATLYPSAEGRLPIICTLAGICLLGIIGGIVWCVLGYRGSTFHDLYMRQGRGIEKEARMRKTEGAFGPSLVLQRYKLGQ